MIKIKRKEKVGKEIDIYASKNEVTNVAFSNLSSYHLFVLSNKSLLFKSES